MTALTVADLEKRIERLQRDVAELIRTLKERPAAAFAGAVEPVAVRASKAAAILDVPLKTIYQLNRDGKLHGFSVTKNSELRFLVADLRELAERLSEKR